MKKSYPYLMISCITISTYFMLHFFLKSGQTAVIHAISRSAFLLLVICFLFQGWKKQERLLTFLVAGGIILRLSYMSYTWYFVRGHDVTFFDDAGHINYVLSLLAGRLPTTNLGQFYHPPLQHFQEALVLKMYAFFTNVPLNHYLNFDVIKLVPALQSCLLLPIGIRICRGLHLTERATVLAIALLAFHPAFIYLAGSINNDMGMLFFFCFALMATIEWYNEPSYSRIALTALWIGCCLMTKVSGGLIALFTGPVFLFVFSRAVLSKQTAQITGLLRQFVLFAVICFPLGLWYPLRNLLSFGQSFGYVYPLDPLVLPQLYSGNVSFVERFLFPRIAEWLSVYPEVEADNNLFLFSMKTVVFGEKVLENRPQPIGHLLFYSSFLLAVLAIWGMLRVVSKGKGIHPLARYGLFSIWVVQIGFFLFFNFKYPFRCTMDARYILPALVVSLLYLGIALDQAAQEASKNKCARLYFRGGIILLGIFICCTSIFYL